MTTKLLRFAFALACVAPVLSVACGGGSTPPATPATPAIPRPAGLSAQSEQSPTTPSAPSALPDTTASAIIRPIVPAMSPKPEMPAVASTSLLDAYRQQLWAIIAAHRPPGVHLDGEVGIRFMLDPDGALRSAAVARSSGDPMMDRLALGTVRRAAPFPKPPPDGSGSLTVEIRFRFR